MRRRRVGPAVTPDAFTISELLAFTSGWMPPDADRPRCDERFTDWPGYLDAYEQVREALQAEEAPGAAPLFAERVRTFAQRHGLPALRAAGYYELRAEPVP